MSRLLCVCQGFVISSVCLSSVQGVMVPINNSEFHNVLFPEIPMLYVFAIILPQSSRELYNNEQTFHPTLIGTVKVPNLEHAT